MAQINYNIQANPNGAAFIDTDPVTLGANIAATQPIVLVEPNNLRRLPSRISVLWKNVGDVIEHEWVIFPLNYGETLKPPTWATGTVFRIRAYCSYGREADLSIVY